MAYLELDSDYKNEAEQYLKNEVHKFAKEEIRPVAKKLDNMPYEEYKKTILSDNSPHDQVMEKMKELGYHKVLIPPKIRWRRILWKLRPLRSERMSHAPYICKAT